MFESKKVKALDAEILALRKQLSLEKEFSECRRVLLQIIGIDINRLESGIPLTEICDPMMPLSRVFFHRVRACKVDTDGLNENFSQLGIEWSDRILMETLRSEQC